jgi:alpha-ketoglutarate-dependent 2,4-dichlorophenoxyacetate dioxygenase
VCAGQNLVLVRSRVAAAGGQTEFADLRAAYEALDGPLRSASKELVAEHSVFHSR